MAPPSRPPPHNPSRTLRHKPIYKPAHKNPPHPKKSPINPLKQKIRSLTRLLTHSLTLPLDVRIEKERALAGYKQDLERAELEKKRQVMIPRYHMVRFFDRKKASRNVKRLKARLAAAEEEEEQKERESLSSAGDEKSKLEMLKTALRHAEIDLKYTIYHPLTEKYTSLFPPRTGAGELGGLRGGGDDGDGDDDDAGAGGGDGAGGGGGIEGGRGRGKPRMWKVIEDCMAEGRLEALREGREGGRYCCDGGGGGKGIGIGKEGKDVREEEGQKVGVGVGVEEGDEGSDGGFFEM